MIFLYVFLANGQVDVNISMVIILLIHPVDAAQ